MMRFFARIFAIVVAGAVFAACAAILIQMRPESLGGWAVMAGLALGALLAPVVLYRALMRPLWPSRPPNEGEGAGLSMGAGIDNARRRDGEDPDIFGD